MSRTRTKGQMSTLQLKLQYYTNLGVADGAPVNFDNPSVEVRGERQTTIDVVTPSFRKKRRQGDIVMSPLVISKKKISSPSNEVFRAVGWNGSVSEFTGDITAYFSALSGELSAPDWYQRRIDDAKDRTLIDAYSNVASSEAQALVTFIEAGKTAQMLLKPFATSLEILGRINKRKLQLLAAGWSLAKASAAAWLEYRLGWKPTLYDIQNIMSAYDASTKARSGTRRLVSRSSEEITHIGESPFPAPFAQWVDGHRTRSIFTSASKVSSGVLYELKDETLAAAKQRAFGLNLDDVPASVWELVPLSFVVDRFVKVGAWLDAITPKTGVTILGDWTTELHRQSHQCELIEWKRGSQYDQNYPGQSYTGSGPYQKETFDLVRTVNNGVPALPSFNQRPLSIQQTVDHISLIIAKLGGIRIPKR